MIFVCFIFFFTGGTDGGTGLAGGVRGTFVAGRPAAGVAGRRRPRLPRRSDVAAAGPRPGLHGGAAAAVDRRRRVALPSPHPPLLRRRVGPRLARLARLFVRP